MGQRKKLLEERFALGALRLRLEASINKDGGALLPSPKGYVQAGPCGIQGVWSPSPTGVFYSSTTRPMLPNSRFHGANLRVEAKGLLNKTGGTSGNFIKNSMKIFDLVYDLVYHIA
jgi:hypothetical protein